MQTGKYIKFLLSMMLSACLILFSLGSCGLDTFYYLDEPKSDGHQNLAVEGESDYLQDYFTCLSNEEASTGSNYEYFDSSSDFKFLGTEVVYRIYNSLSTLNSAVSSIESMASSTSSSTNAATNLIETKGYKPLKLDKGSVAPLMQAGSTPNNRHLYVRLTSYGEDPKFQSSICISDMTLTTFEEDAALRKNGEIVKPRRYIDNSFGFEFNSGDENNPVPKSDDDDVTYSSTATEDGVWYVDMFALSVGRDATFTTTYSIPYHMGSVRIAESDYAD